MEKDLINQISQFSESKTYTTPALTKSTLASFRINPAPIMNTLHTRVGAKGDSSVSFDTPGVFTTEVSANNLLNDGDYFINYVTGECKVIPATNAGSGVGITYYVNELTVTPSAQASVYKTTAYAASGVIKNSAGSFYGLFGYNSKTSDQYLQLHDAASVPADSAVPLAVIAIPAESTFSIDCQMAGIPFSTGIVWCNSSTAPTKTIGSADVFLTALYL